MRYQNKQKHILLLAIMVFAVMSIFGSAEAMNFTLNDDTKIDCDVTLSWASGWRAKDRDMDTKAMNPDIGANSDDGGWNFDQWDMINNRLNAIADIDVQYKNMGIFLRPRVFYDFVYMRDNSNPGPYQGVGNPDDFHNTNNNYAAGTISEPDKFDSGVRDIMGTEAGLLDWFFYTNFSVADRWVDFRIGQQVLAWGEQLYLSGGVASAMSYADLTAANLPGVELKEIYMPSESVSVRMDVLNNLSMAAFYQWEWEPLILNEAGSFFSDSDVVDEAGHLLFYGPFQLPRVADDDAKDDGQYGLSLILRVPALAETEFGFYYINYHEKSPLLQFVPNPVIPIYPGSYYFTYAEDVKLYGMSVSTFVGDVSLSGEYTYRHNYPIEIATGVFEQGNMVQTQMAWLYSLGYNPIFDDVSINGEIGLVKVLGIDGEEMTYSDFAWGFSLSVTPKYYQLIPNLDLELPISYKCNPSGSSPNKTFTEGADSIAIGTTFTYKNVYKLEIKYVDYFNPTRNTLADRDLIGVNLKYTF